MPTFEDRDRGQEISHDEQTAFISVVDERALPFGIRVPETYAEYATMEPEQHSGMVEFDPLSDEHRVPAVSIECRSIPATGVYQVRREVHLKNQPEVIGDILLRSVTKYGILQLAVGDPSQSTTHIPYVTDESEYPLNWTQHEEYADYWALIAVEFGILKAIMQEHGTFEAAKDIALKGFLPSPRTFVHNDFAEVMRNLGEEDNNA